MYLPAEGWGDAQGQMPHISHHTNPEDAFFEEYRFWRGWSELLDVYYGFNLEFVRIIPEHVGIPLVAG